MAGVVMRSIEDATGDRCVDLLRFGARDWGWVACRRDPEDAHGWRRLSDVTSGFETDMSALDAARAAVGWMEADGR